MGERVPGVLGDEPPVAGDLAGPARNGQFPPVVSGTDDAVQLDDLKRMITAVTKDWTPPSPKTTPQISVGGKTLEEVANHLNAQGEWGQGGGILRTDPVPVGVSESVAVAAHAGLIFRLPQWTGYAKASAAAQAEWDRMMVKLRDHEQRHLDITIEEADNLARDLVGKEIGEIPALVTEANKRMNDRQVKLDADTDHGSKDGVKYGGVSLDITIT